MIRAALYIVPDGNRKGTRDRHDRRRIKSQLTLTKPDPGFLDHPVLLAGLDFYTGFGGPQELRARDVDRGILQILFLYRDNRSPRLPLLREPHRRRDLRGNLRFRFHHFLPRVEEIAIYRQGPTRGWISSGA